MLKNLWTLKKYYRRYWRGMVAGILFLLVCDASELAVPPLIGIAFDALAQLWKKERIGTPGGILDFSVFSPMTAIMVLALSLVVIQLSRGVFSFLQRTFIVRISRRNEHDLRVDFFSHLLKLSPSYYDKTKTGDLMARSTNDLAAVRMSMGPGVMAIFDILFMATGALVIMLTRKPVLTAYAIMPLALLPFIVWGFGGPIKRRFQKIQEQFGDINAACQENFSGIRVIKAFAREGHEKASFRALCLDYVAKNISLAKTRSIFRPLLFLLAGTSIAIVMWRGGIEVAAGSMTVGQLMEFVLYVQMLTWPMIAIGWVFILLQQGDASMGRIQEILDQKPTIADSPDDTPLETAKGAIEFRNLTFTYRGADRPALTDINLHIPAGRTLALVGPAGAGKSTLVRLIARLYEVSEGRLFIDGRDVTGISLRDLRRSIAFVPQETFLFSDSIAANIKYGTPDAAMATVKGAAEAAQISADVEHLPRDYKQMLGERGINLSGGQKQRMAIARAVIRNAPILILDDALSSVDTHTEERILQHLRGLMKQRTSIIISHRLSSIQDADRIVVLEDGVITQTGSHKELMQQAGFYSETYRQQQIEDSLKEL